MFEVGFSELCMVGLVALLVIGPERLPKVARMVGFWIGKARRIIEAAKADIHSELQAEEIRQLLKDNANYQNVLDEKINTLNTLNTLDIHEPKSVVDNLSVQKITSHD